jgi:hypothetical protein
MDFSFAAETPLDFRYTVRPGRGTQVVRERSAKPLYVGSIPTRASTLAPAQRVFEIKIPEAIKIIAAI